MANISPLHCILPYVASFAMDELDGRFARMFKQTSTFGQVLDMVTDRVSTTGLLAILCYFVPHLQIVWLSLVSLDLFSHWFQMYAALACGASTHKVCNNIQLLAAIIMNKVNLMSLFQTISR